MKKRLHLAGLVSLSFAFIASYLLIAGHLLPLDQDNRLNAAEDSFQKIPRPIGDISVDGPDEVPTGQLAMFTIKGVKLEDLTADPPNIGLLCVPKPQGVFYVVWDIMGRTPAALLQSHKPATLTIVLIDYQGRKHNLKEVRVKGDPGPDPPPDPDPNPDPDPPQPEPEGWAKWTKTNAEKLITNPNRKQEAQALSRALEATVSAYNAGVYKTPAELRASVKAANVKSFVDLYKDQTKGRARALEWDVKFDSALEENIRRSIPDLSKVPLSEWARLYGQIAEGLKLVN